MAKKTSIARLNLFLINYIVLTRRITFISIPSFIITVKVKAEKIIDEYLYF